MRHSDDYLLSVEDVLERLRIRKTTLYYLMATGKIESVKVGRLRRFKPSQVSDYIASLDNGA